MFLKMQASFSVFLVAVLSITRTVILFRPFLDISTRTVLLVVGGYGVYLVLNQVVPLVLQKTRFVYTSEEVYCWDDGTSQVWDKLDIWLDLIVLAVPVVPITISCVLSCIFVGRKGKYLSETASGGSANSKRATRTIILMTAVYILFNIPLFVNYLLWTISVNTGNVTYPDPYWNTTFTYWFVWNFTDCLFINLNSLFNPLVYFMRIKTFKEWVYERCRAVKGKISSTFVLKCR
ncbi:G-protein coupled receptor 183-A-like [Bolinopsis microptera]|uniref:G-protein coupled receptor 183-A-like n=1 Tax=Bolinopsis microptera TaxID=2820187 RepID=UPI0030791483